MRVRRKARNSCLHTNRSPAFTIERNDRFGGLPSAPGGAAALMNAC
jgi:hypothetical protein